MMKRMPDEQKKPDPIEDIRAGLGLLFRAAKTAVDEFPTEKIEEAVKEGAREFGRALESMGEVIDEKVLGNKKPKHPPPSDASASASAQSVQSAQPAPPQVSADGGGDANPPAEPTEPKGNGS